MSFKLHFLGTSCMVPTKDRNQIATALEHNGNIFIFDCGEGAQNQIKKMKIPIGKIKKIFISHWHGDHTLGLSGLIQTLSNTENVEKIEIHGPQKSKFFIKNILNSMIFEQKIPIKVFEYKPKSNEVLKIIDNADYEISVAKLNHSVPCIGYVYKEKDKLNIDKVKVKKLGLENSILLARIKLGLNIKYKGKIIKPENITYKKLGLKIAFVFDTRPCKGASLLARNADYLVIEASHFHEKHKQKAEETMHMTAKESSQIALENNVKNLILTHFSQRYKEPEILLEEAQILFENTILAYDLMTIKLKIP